MTVMYKSVAKAEPGVVGGGQMKYYAAIVRERPVGLRKFANAIARTSRLNTSDVFGILETFLDNLHEYLEEGRIIQLGDLGTFTPSINSLGSDTSEGVSRASIIRFKVNFRPGKYLRKRLSQVEFSKVVNDSTEEEDPEVQA
ncbi:MAG: HU family DNA-binding protein [Marinoscillum sp.]